MPSPFVLGFAAGLALLPGLAAVSWLALVLYELVRAVLALALCVRDGHDEREICSGPGWRKISCDRCLSFRIERDAE